MKYLIVISDIQLNDFQKVDGNPLEIKVADKDGSYHILDARPIQREMLVMPNGGSAYITQGHVDAMMKYEHEQHIKEIVDKMNHNLDGINEFKLPYHAPLLTPEEIKRQFGND